MSSTIGRPYRSTITSARVRFSHRPSARRMPASPCITERSRTASPRPSDSSAAIAFGAMATAEPTGSSRGARSHTVTRQPRRSSATAAVRPPIPAPITTACFMISSFIHL